MRLWHVDLIPKLPRQQLLGQHRECTALRGLGWGKKHATVNYVFKHPYSYLYTYHVKIMQEMKQRGYNVTSQWWDYTYRGKAIGFDYSPFTYFDPRKLDYPEHNKAYLQECLENLKGKGIRL